MYNIDVLRWLKKQNNSKVTSKLTGNTHAYYYHRNDNNLFYVLRWLKTVPKIPGNKREIHVRTITFV